MNRYCPSEKLKRTPCNEGTRRHATSDPTRFIFSTSSLRSSRRGCHRPWKARAGSLVAGESKARRTGFLARMLPCEKSVGGIPTRRTLSLQPWRPRRRVGVAERWILRYPDPGGVVDEVSGRRRGRGGSFSFLLFLVLLLPLLFPASRVLVRRGWADEAPGRNDSFRGARATIRAA